MNKMKETLVSFTVAKLAKEKGFGANGSYYTKDRALQHMVTGICFDYYCAAPTQSLLQKSLRDEYGINVNVNTDVTLMWIYTIQSLHPQASYIGNFIVSDSCWSNYEEALEAGLSHAFTLFK